MGIPADWINYLTYQLEQVKLQQEVRDRWFGYYLTIAGAVLGVGIGAVKLFATQTFDRRLWTFVIVLTVAMLLIGSCFFMLYLRQRLNYHRFYRHMDATEEKLNRSSFWGDGKPDTGPGRQEPGKTFLLQSKTADFYTLWIHIIINSFYCGLTVFVALLLTTKSTEINFCRIAAFLLAFFAAAVIFEVIRRKHYELTDTDSGPPSARKPPGPETKGGPPESALT